MKRMMMFTLLLIGMALPVTVQAQDEDEPEMSEEMEGMEDEADGIPMTVLAAFVLSVVGAGLAWGLRSTFGLENLDYAIIGLTLYTSLVHLRVGIGEEDTLLLLNGIGYAVLLGALYLPPINKWQLWIVLGLLVYTLITFFGYFVEHNTADHIDLEGVTTKIAEALLIVTLGIMARNIRRAPVRDEG